jgi:hypothetical protein
MPFVILCSHARSNFRNGQEAALGAGKMVYLGAPWAKWSFRFHPRVRYFETLEQAVAVLDTFPTPDCANNAPFASM